MPDVLTKIDDLPVVASPTGAERIECSQGTVGAGTDGRLTAQQIADLGGLVDSVFGRTGAVVAENDDYTASQIANVAAGGISADNVQGALNELDTEKLPNSHKGTGGAEHAAVTTSVNGFMTAADKTKLDGLSGGAVKLHSGINQTRSNTTATFPQDDTIPQISEGAQVVTTGAFTPAAGSLLLVTYFAILGHATNGANVQLMLFKQGTNDAKAGIYIRIDVDGNLRSVSAQFVETAVAEAQTWEVRYGSSSGTTYLNSTNVGNFYGANTLKSGLTILEIPT